MEELLTASQLATKEYWHEMSLVRRKRVLFSEISVGEFMRKYKQPRWCHYPDALAGVMGCWSLVSSRITVSENYCKNCECCNTQSFRRK